MTSRRLAPRDEHQTAEAISVFGAPASLEEARGRYEQAMRDGDIEGLARDPDGEREDAAWRDAGLSVEDRLERLKARFSRSRPLAAE